MIKWGRYLVLVLVLALASPPLTTGAAAQDAAASSASSSSSIDDDVLWALGCVAIYDYLASQPGAVVTDERKSARDHAARFYAFKTGRTNDELEWDKQVALEEDGFVTGPQAMANSAIACDGDFNFED